MGLVTDTIPGQTQTVATDRPLGAYGRVGQALLHLASCKPLPSSPGAVIGNLPMEALPLVDLLYQGKPRSPYRWQGMDLTPWYSDENHARCLLAFSGGKDSVAAACILNAMGCDVTLFHVTGINRSAPGEQLAAGVLAETLQMPLVQQNVVYKGPATPDLENRMKNQFIAGLQLDYARLNDIGSISQGNYRGETLGTLAHHACFTDAVECYDAWATAFPVVRYRWGLLRSDSQAYRAILDHRPQCQQNIMSCIHPFRFRAMRLGQVEAKWGVRLPVGRCGVCYKCCLEYIILAENSNWYAHCTGWQAPYALHCLDVIAKTWGVAYQAHLQPVGRAATLAAVVDQAETATPLLLEALANE